MLFLHKYCFFFYSEQPSGLPLCPKYSLSVREIVSVLHRSTAVMTSISCPPNWNYGTFGPFFTCVTLTENAKQIYSIVHREHKLKQLFLVNS